MKQRSAKSLQITFLCYSNVKYTLKVPLTLIKFEKPNMRISILFIFFLSFFSVLHNSKTIRYVWIYAYQTTALLMEIIPTCVELHMSYNW